MVLLNNGCSLSSRHRVAGHLGISVVEVARPSEHSLPVLVAAPVAVLVRDPAGVSLAVLVGVTPSFSSLAMPYRSVHRS
jgi:hypothetical protein